jgi:cellulose synthase/poly-beta-1,6-N-acetylglucosamine synthase-like glycosyltransferase
MTLVISILVGLYALLILVLTSGYRRLPEFEPDHSPAQHSFSIIIVFRNEVHNMDHLIGNLNNLDYPADKFEILLVDDESEDGSLERVQRLKAEYRNLDISIMESRSRLDNDHEMKDTSAPGSPKKAAIEKAVRKAKYDWILTTDADCSLKIEHLRAYDQFIRDHDPILVAGPVICTADNSFLKRFQLLDFISLQGSTMGSFGGREISSWLRPFMCNGANLCYRKAAFSAVNGYEGTRHIASGDDVFLLEKMLSNDASRVCFIKSRAATVETQPLDSWGQLVEQRKRWAAKTSSYSDRFGKIVGLLVLLANLSLITGFGLALGGLISWNVFGLLFLIKINVDFVLLYNTALFFEKQEALRSYLLSGLLYPFFTVFVALLAMNGNYQWKGRSFEK